MLIILQWALEWVCKDGSYEERKNKMKRRGRLTFEFFKTQEMAEQFAKSRRLRKFFITPWSLTDGRENLFVIWYRVW